MLYKNLVLFLLGMVIISCAGSNATTMEYRSATTAVRSERDLNKGEKYALKALNMVEHANDARVAYFLAIEIYKPRKNWKEMNRMLDIAMNRNPFQKLDRPFKLDDGKVIQSISEAVPIYKEQIWMNIFNQTIDLIDQEKIEEAAEKIEYAKTVLEKIENYLTSALLNLQLNNENNAKSDLDNALQLDPDNSRALQILGDIEFKASNLNQAIEYYQKAMAHTEDQNTQNDINKSLIFIYVELENYDDAIQLSESLLKNNLDDPDIYFNAGVIYQRLATDFYDRGFKGYKSSTNSDDINQDIIKEANSDFKKSYEMTQKSLNYFMDSSMAEEYENNSTDQAIDEMRRLRKNLKEIYMPSIKKIAIDNNIQLD